LISSDNSKTDILLKDGNESGSPLPSLQSVLGYLLQK